MSQAILKLQKGNKTPETTSEKLFKDGNRNVSLKLLEDSASKGINQYLEGRNWSRKKRQAFMDAYSDMITSIDNGTISQRNLSRQYIDSSGKLENSKKKGFDAYGEAAYYLGTILDKTPEYSTEEKKESKKKYDPNGLLTQFRNKYFGGNDIDAEIWQQRDVKDSKTGKYGTANRAKAFADVLENYSKSINDSDYDYSDSAFKDKEDLLSRINTAIAQLRDNKVDNNDYSALASLGISGDSARALFSVDPLNQSSDSSQQSDGQTTQQSSDPELEKAQQQLEQMDKDKERQATLDKYNNEIKERQLRQQLTSQWYEPAKNFQREILQLPKVSYDRMRWANLMKGSNQNKYYTSFGQLMSTYDPVKHSNMMVFNGLHSKNGDRMRVSYLQHLANNLDYLNSINALQDSGWRGWKYYRDSIDKKSGTVYLYNPTTNQIIREAVYRVPALKNMLLQGTQQNTNPNPFMKEGGVIEFQFGGPVNYQALTNNYINSQKKLQAQKQKKQEQYRKEHKDEIKLSDKGLDGTDYARIGAALLDLGSAVSSFVPGIGTVASGATGVASTLVNFGADVAEDGLDAGDFKRLGANAAMDAVGLIPGLGASGKAGKVAKTLGKTLPKLLVAFNTVQLGYHAPEITASLKKLVTGDFKNLTTSDLQNIGTALSAIAAGSRGHNSMKQRNVYKKAAATGKMNLQDASGKYRTVSKQDLEGIKQAKTLEEANTLFKKATGDKNAELASTFRGSNPFTKKFYKTSSDPRYGEEFDFSKVKQGERNFGSDKGIGRGKGRALDEWFYMKKVGQGRPDSKPSIIGQWLSKIKLSPNYDVYNKPKPKTGSETTQQSAKPQQETSQPKQQEQNTQTTEQNNNQQSTTTQQAATQQTATQQTNTQTKQQQQSKPKQQEQPVTQTGTQKPESQNKQDNTKQQSGETKKTVDQKIAEQEQKKSEIGWFQAEQSMNNQSSSVKTQQAVKSVGQKIQEAMNTMPEPDTKAYTKRLNRDKSKSATNLKQQREQNRGRKKVRKKEFGGVIFAQDGTKLYNYGRYNPSFFNDWSGLVAGPVTQDVVNGRKNTYGKVGKASGYKFDTTSRLNTALGLIANKKITLDDVDMFQRRHAGLYAGYNPSMHPIFNQKVKDYQTDWNGIGLNQSIILPGYNTNYDIASKHPISGDGSSSNWRSDGMYDQITDDRRILARKEDYYTNGVFDQQKFDSDVALAKAQGYDYYLDPESNYYMLKPITSQAETKPQVTTNESKINEYTNWRKPIMQVVSQYASDLKPDLISIGRLTGSIINNNRVTKETLAGLRPLLRDTFQLNRYVRGDLASKQNYYNNAAQLESFADRPRTSDASLQFAGQLDTRLKANQLRAQGEAIDNQAIKQSADQAWQVNAQNTERRSNVANLNRQAMLGIDAAKHQINAARMSANWTGNIDPFLKEQEYKARTAQEQQRAFNLKVAQQKLQDLYSSDDGVIKSLQDKLVNAPAGTDITTMPEYKQLQDLQKQKTNDYLNAYNRAYAQIYGLRYPTYQYQKQYFKSGGSVEVAQIRAQTQSAKMFQDNIKEQVRNNIRMINNLSSVTKQLILKSMTL